MISLMKTMDTVLDLFISNQAYIIAAVADSGIRLSESTQVKIFRLRH